MRVFTANTHFVSPLSIHTRMCMWSRVIRYDVLWRKETKDTPLTNKAYKIFSPYNKLLSMIIAIELASVCGFECIVNINNQKPSQLCKYKLTPCCIWWLCRKGVTWMRKIGPVEWCTAYICGWHWSAQQVNNGVPLNIQKHDYSPMNTNNSGNKDFSTANNRQKCTGWLERKTTRTFLEMARENVRKDQEANCWNPCRQNGGTGRKGYAC